MSQHIDIHITNPLTGEQRILGFSTSFTIGSCEPCRVIVQGDFLEAEHGIFDYSEHIGWYYIDNKLKNSKATTVKNKSSRTFTATNGKPLSLKAGDMLVLNQSVKIEVLKVVLHDGREI